MAEQAGSPPLRIAYLVSQYPAISHTFILREIRYLRASGLDISVVSIRPPDRPADQLSAEERSEAEQTFYVKRAGLRRILVDHLSILANHPSRYARGLFYAVRAARLDLRKIVFHLAYFAQAVVVGQWMTRRRLAHVHTHFSSSVALFLSVVFPMPISLTIHGSDEFKDSIGFLLPEKIARSLFVCAISNYGKSQLARVSRPGDWSKLETVPLGVDPVQFAPRPFRSSPQPMEILSVGRLAPPKAQMLLIEAARMLVAEGRPLLLRLVGDGPDRAMLEQEAVRRGMKDHVVFEGALPQDRVRELYRRSDIFALSSFAEGVPVVLMEAMAMEIPCVATWVTGVPELIRNGVDGLLVAPFDPEALAGAIARLQDDPALRQQLGEAGRRRVLEKYDLTRNVARLAAVFRARLQARPEAERTKSI